MAWINCAACRKLEDSSAVVCRHCGCPPKAAPSTAVAKRAVGEPKLPDDLSIPTQVFGFGFTASEFSATVSNACEIPGAPLGESVQISRRKEGLSLFGLYGKALTRVHYSQVFAAQFIEAMKVEQHSKSVLGRAAVGAILLGPFGAVVGGMSGMSKDEKPVHGMRLTFWNTEKKRYDSLLLESGNRDLLRDVVRLIATESAPYRALHDEAMAEK